MSLKPTPETSSSWSTQFQEKINLWFEIFKPHNKYCTCSECEEALDEFMLWQFPEPSETSQASQEASREAVYAALQPPHPAECTCSSCACDCHLCEAYNPYQDHHIHDLLEDDPFGDDYWESYWESYDEEEDRLQNLREEKLERMREDFLNG